MRKQRPAKEIVQEFHHLAGRLRNWPERILVHYFKECLDEELLKICLCRAPGEFIHEWYQVAVAMNNEIRQHCRAALEKLPRRQLG